MAENEIPIGYGTEQRPGTSRRLTIDVRGESKRLRRRLRTYHGLLVAGALVLLVAAILAFALRGRREWGLEHDLEYRFLGLQCFSLSPDGRMLAAYHDGHDVAMWDVDKGILLRLLSGHQGRVQGMGFSPGSNVLVTGARDKTAILWDVNSGDILSVLQGHGGNISCAVFSHKGSRLVTASSDHSLRIWEARTGTCLATLEGHEGRVFYAEWSLSDDRILSVGEDMTARIWDAGEAKKVATVGLADLLEAGRPAAFLGNGEKVIGARGIEAGIWDATSGELVGLLQGHRASIAAVACSPDGAIAVTGSFDGTARVWDRSTHRCLAVLDGHDRGVIGAQLADDDTILATWGMDGTARIWDLRTFSLSEVLIAYRCRSEEAAAPGLWAASFTPDASRIVTASEDGALRIWRRRRGACFGDASGDTHRFRTRRKR